MRKLITNISLALLVVLTGMQPVLAQTSEQNPAASALTKAFVMADGAETPGLTFDFELIPVSVDGKAATAGNMPDIGTKSVTFSAADNGAVTDGVKTIYKESENLFANVNWPHAGVYVYNIKETPSVKGTLGAGETITYSEAEYKVKVYVANGANGLYLAAVGAELTVTDGGEGTEGSNKVDSQPGGDPSVTGDYSKMIFTNNYMKKNGSGDPMDYNLAISKEVKSPDGDGHNFADKTMYFDFKVTATKSSANYGNNVKYRVYVMEGDTVVTNSQNYAGTILTDAQYGDYIVLDSGTEYTVHLKHGQWLSFVDLEIGATYTVTELGRENYTPSCAQTVNGTVTDHSAVANSDLVIAATTITGGDNRADFTNTYMSITPVGVSVDNLPYVILIALVVIGLGIYLVYKSRRRRR